MTVEGFKGKRIAILGLGVNNKSLAQYLKNKGIDFEVIDDWDNPGELVGRISGFEFVFRTPGLPLSSQAIAEAQKSGTIIYSQTKLFFDLCPARIIGVTGTKGKGTTASLIFQILKRNFQFPIFPPSGDLYDNFQTNSKPEVYLAGNIGIDPFEFLDKLKAEDWVVLELSSFQLQDLHKSPHIAVVLKITPEHLDYHQTFEEYVDAKLPIVRFQSEVDFAVLNYDTEITRQFADDTRAQIYWNSIEHDVRPGCFVRDEKIILTPHLTSLASPQTRVEAGREGNSAFIPPPRGGRLGGGEIEVMNISEVQLLGRFNLENVTAAIAAASAAGVNDADIIRKAVSEFRGLEHRLEFVREIKGVRFYNDSFATTPETTMAALTAFDSPIVLIAGGSEKNSNYHGLAKKIDEKQVKALLAVGVTGPKIVKLARDAGYDGKIYDTGLTDMEKIVARADSIADPGDVVLLSPASASFDMFANYKHRGELFKKFVNKLAALP